MVVVQKGSFDYVSSSFCRFIYTTALDVLGKANRPVEALNVFHSMQVLYIYFFAYSMLSACAIHLAKRKEKALRENTIYLFVFV